MDAQNRHCRIHYYDLTVRADAVGDDVFPLLKDLRPQWGKENVLSEVFTAGVINDMVCFYHIDDKHKRDALMVRVFGKTVGDINPREREFMNIQIANAARCFPEIYASFNNGLSYQYAVGRHANYHDIIKPENIRIISRLLYRLHNLDIDNITLVDRKGIPATYDKAPTLFDKTMDYISSIPVIPKNQKKIEKFKQLRKDLSDQILMEEFAFVKSIVDDIPFPMSFNHMDIHPRNIIINDQTGDITFVDMEISCFSYTYFDLASLFVSKKIFDAMGFTSPDEPDISPDVRKLYLQSYLEAKHEAEGESEITDVEAELLDIKHSILETMQSFQSIAMILALVDVGVNDNFDFLDLIPMFMEDYLAGKEKLGALKNRYIELKDRDQDRLAK